MRALEPLGHERVIAGMFAAARAERLAHALLFVGPRGVGKFLAAEWLAAGLVCARGIGPPCGTCPPCKRARADTHPDLLVVDPERDGAEEIGIGYVTRRDGSPARTIEEFLALRPMEGGWRVVLVRDAGLLNESAQNALLKTLEEPGDRTLLVLETSRPDRLLPTIHSRSVRVPFEPLDAALSLAVLAEAGVAPADARLLARIGRGAPGEAVRCARRGVLDMRAALDRVARRAGDPFELAAEILVVEGDFPGDTPLAANRQRARTCLDLALAVVLDEVRARAGVARASLAHGDLEESFAAFGDAALASALDRLLEARQDVDHNLAPDLVLQRAFLALEPPGPRPKGSPR